MSRYNNSICSDDAPSWEALGERLKMLNVIDYNITSRLKYEEFEMIFYNLFHQIDPTDSRKKFRSMYPARNYEDRSRFMETAAHFINDRHISPYKIVSSHLRVLGGEPFRRLLSLIIDEANKKRKYFENLIPQLKLERLFEDQTAKKSKDLASLDIENVLAEYPDPKHSDKDVIEFTRQLFSKGQD